MARKLIKKRVVYTIICGLSFLFFIHIISFNSVSHSTHNCRFWGMVFTGELTLEWKTDVRSHLDSLKGLSWTNNDGWGIGYYVSPYENGILPVISRGEPRALEDPRYNNTVDEMINCIKNGGVAHVRKSSSGPTGGLPNPHPFRRTAIDSSRYFDMLFAHNGTISTSVLLSLIDSTYLTLNPPDYNPNFLDSDLYAIYIIETIDKYPSYSIDRCIKIAITNLTAQLPGYATLNFVLTDGSTLWALRYADINTNYYTLYYFPSTPTSEKWEVASQPLDNNLLFWAEIPNYSLVTLVPNEPPEIYSFESKEYIEPSKSFAFEKLYPNPSRDVLKIRYRSPDRREVVIALYDASGRLVENVFSGKAEIGMNETPYTFKNLPSGVYFVQLKTEEKQMTRKIIFQR